jgi:hypothetical protein
MTRHVFLTFWAGMSLFAAHAPQGDGDGVRAVNPHPLETITRCLSEKTVSEASKLMDSFQEASKSNPLLQDLLVPLLWKTYKESPQILDKRAAIDLLGRLKPAGLEKELLEKVKAKNTPEWIRWNFIDILAKMKSKDLVPVLAEMVGIQAQPPLVAKALAEIGDDSVYPLLLVYSLNKEWPGDDALRALGERAKKDPALIPALQVIIRNNNQFGRWLSSMGKAFRDHPALMDRINSDFETLWGGANQEGFKNEYRGADVLEEWAKVNPAKVKEIIRSQREKLLRNPTNVHTYAGLVKNGPPEEQAEVDAAYAVLEKRAIKEDLGLIRDIKAWRDRNQPEPKRTYPASTRTACQLASSELLTAAPLPPEHMTALRSKLEDAWFKSESEVNFKGKRVKAKVNLESQFPHLSQAQYGGTCHLYALSSIMEEACLRFSGQAVCISPAYLYYRHVRRNMKRGNWQRETSFGHMSPVDGATKEDEQENIKEILDGNVCSEAQFPSDFNFAYDMRVILKDYVPSRNMETIRSLDRLVERVHGLEGTLTEGRIAPFSRDFEACKKSLPKPTVKSFSESKAMELLSRGIPFQCDGDTGLGMRPDPDCWHSVVVSGYAIKDGEISWAVRDSIDNFNPDFFSKNYADRIRLSKDPKNHLLCKEMTYFE